MHLILLTYGSRWNSSYCQLFDAGGCGVLTHPPTVPLPFLEMATFESSDVKTGTHSISCVVERPTQLILWDGWLWSCFAFACCSSKNRPPLAYHITFPYFIIFHLTLAAFCNIFVLHWLAMTGQSSIHPYPSLGGQAGWTRGRPGVGRLWMNFVGLVLYHFFWGAMFGVL